MLEICRHYQYANIFRLDRPIFASSSNRWVVWNHGGGDGRNQSKPLSHRGTFYRPRGDSGTRECCGGPLGGGVAFELGGDARMDGTDFDVSQPGWWNCRDMCGGISSLQSSFGEPDGGLLLVGMGANVWVDGDSGLDGSGSLVPASHA